MKTIKILFTLIALACLGIGMDANGQCSPEQYTEECIPKLQEGFNFVKSYEINGKGGDKDKIEYSYVFAKGTQYFISICSAGETPDGIVMNLYDSERNKVGSTLIDGKKQKGIIYPCESTGIYYITFTFNNSQNYCGGAVLGFKR